jgi:hypothetical protein
MYIYEQICVLFLKVFAFLRPLFALSFFVGRYLGGFKLAELFGICSSYFFIFFSIKNLVRAKIDIVGLFCLLFCFYALLTIFWGSPYKEIVRLILPFAVFFVASTEIRREDSIKILLCIVIGFIIPVLLSSYSIVTGTGLWATIYWTGLDRYKGSYEAPHQLAHNMFVCIFSALFYLQLASKKGSIGIKKMICIYSLVGLAAYNLYMSYTRNVYIGLSIYLFFHLYGLKKYLYLVTGLITMATVALYAGFFKKIFFDVYEPLANKGDIGSMGSGRIGGWSSILNNFFSAPIEEQIRGLGITLHGTITKGAQFGGSHNDMLSALICFGYIGFFLISCVYVALAYKILIAPVDRDIKCSFIGLLVAVGAMNLLSNSYLTRFELGQFFWLLIGIYYSLGRNQPEGIRA